MIWGLSYQHSRSPKEIAHDIKTYSRLPPDGTYRQHLLACMEVCLYMPGCVNLDIPSHETSFQNLNSHVIINSIFSQTQ